MMLVKALKSDVFFKSDISCYKITFDILNM